MNQSQLFEIRGQLLALQQRVANIVTVVDAAISPDAGLVVKGENIPPASCWDGAFFRDEGEQRMNTTRTSHPALHNAEIGGSILHLPHPQLNHASPSHLTIADGRGDAEVTTRQYPGWDVGWEFAWTGPCPYSMDLGWWYSTTDIRSLQAAYNHEYPPVPQWWHPDEATVIDCASVPHAMTWRAA